MHADLEKRAGGPLGADFARAQQLEPSFAERRGERPWI